MKDSRCALAALVSGILMAWSGSANAAEQIETFSLVDSDMTSGWDVGALGRCDHVTYVNQSNAGLVHCNSPSGGELSGWHETIKPTNGSEPYFVVGGLISNGTTYDPGEDGPISSGEGHIDLELTGITMEDGWTNIIAWLTVYLLVEQDGQYYISDTSVAARMDCAAIGSCTLVSGVVTLNVTDFSEGAFHEISSSVFDDESSNPNFGESGGELHFGFALQGNWHAPFSTSPGEAPRFNKEFTLDNFELTLYTNDEDGDGVADFEDNCLDEPNGPSESPSNQCDTDMDGYGNACDADLNNDGTVGGPDAGMYSAAYGTTGAAGPPGFSVADTNCDGTVGGPDLGILSVQYGGPPGPSGLSCAGSVPCP